MKTSKKRSRETILGRIAIARVLFYADAGLWLGMGGFFLYKMFQDGNDLSTALVAFFFLITILSLVVAARLVDEQEKWVFVTDLSITGINLLLSFTGFPAFLYIIACLLDVILLVNLISLKSYYYKEA